MTAATRNNTATLNDLKTAQVIRARKRTSVPDPEADADDDAKEFAKAFKEGLAELSGGTVSK